MDTKIFGFYANVSVLEQEAVFRHFFCGVSEARQRKIMELRAASGRKSALGAGVLLDYGLRRLFARREREVAIAYGAQGKPYVQDAPDIHFNLSHSGDYALAVFSPTEVGCDLQQTEGRAHTRRVAARFFTEKERQVLMNGMDFYRIWARKESYLKLTGAGMALDLRSFDAVAEEWDAPCGRCRFADYDLPGYALAVCYAGAETFPVSWEEIDLLKELPLF